MLNVVYEVSCQDALEGAASCCVLPAEQGACALFQQVFMGVISLGERKSLVFPLSCLFLEFLMKGDKIFHFYTLFLVFLLFFFF